MLKLFVTVTFLVSINFRVTLTRTIKIHDICGNEEGKRLYLEHGEMGILEAKYLNNSSTQSRYTENNVTVNKCSIEFITCTSCVVDISFRFLNVSGYCEKAPALDSCGCEYVWIVEPQYEDVSGQHFCGRFIQPNSSNLGYLSKTRRVTINLFYNKVYDHVFTLDYVSKRNKVSLTGYPKNRNINSPRQIIASPFFPHYYPNDLNIEYVISCKSSVKCRINLLFTDFLITTMSLIEIFDWNDQRMYVATGNVFRPPNIVSSGPRITIKFYANGGSSLGYKAVYNYITDENLSTWNPDTNCGGYVTNLGGGITMMNMVTNGTKTFDCIWIIRPPNNYFHMKTHLYVKVASFSQLEGGSELRIVSGITSNGINVEMVRNVASQYMMYKSKEHVAPLSQGFYISLRGIFNSESRMAIVYTAFSYKDCFAGTEFLCHNLRCISILFRCDGLDHCGDNSDESTVCAGGLENRLQWSKRPNFLFQRIEHYSDLSTAAFVFLVFSLGLIGIIFSMAMLIYRVNIRERHHRQIQDHIETIHAILEEGVMDVEEEIIIPDEPPDYEAPPDYSDIPKLLYLKKCDNQRENKAANISRNTAFQCQTSDVTQNLRIQVIEQLSPNCINRGCQTNPADIPDSPPPAYITHESSHTVCGKIRDSAFSTGESSSMREMSVMELSSTSFQTRTLQTQLIKEQASGENGGNKQLFTITADRIILRPRYSSDSELIFLYTLRRREELETNASPNAKKFLKSYSSDDINYASDTNY